MNNAIQLDHAALFLDLDGTLVPLAARPDQVFLPPSTAGLLLNLHAACDGAVAVISGRDYASLHMACTKLPLAMISSHGAAMYDADGQECWNIPVNPAEHHSLSRSVAALIHPYPLVWMERKSHGVAVHFRQRPELSDALAAELRVLCLEYPGFELIRGHCVIELRMSGFDKGQALARAQSLPTFAERKPIMIGDDLTDEAAFDFVNQCGGLSIRIGAPEPASAAQFSLPQPTDLLVLLQTSLLETRFFSDPVLPSPAGSQIAAP
ncbi:MAG: trehalose-phosphatase [Alcaligenes sp.]